MLAVIASTRSLRVFSGGTGEERASIRKTARAIPWKSIQGSQKSLAIKGSTERSKNLNKNTLAGVFKVGAIGLEPTDLTDVNRAL